MDTNKEMFEVRLVDIVVKDRARVDMGDLESLALSMHVQTQLVPIIVTDAPNQKYRLVEGERRIRAAKKLGWTKIKAVYKENLSEDSIKELELVTCLQRKQLTFAEEARAVHELVAKRKKEGMHGGLIKFGTAIHNKDVATELNITEQRMSENLRIATALRDHPELEIDCLTRTECLSRIRKRDFYVPSEGALHNTYKENFIVNTPLGCIEGIHGAVVDLAILQPSGVDEELLDAVLLKLKPYGQIVIFTTHPEIPKWTELLQARQLKVSDQPYIWHIKGEKDYAIFIWAGHHITEPNRPIPCMNSYARPSKAMSEKAKPFQLMNAIIKCCTERGAFVLVPECMDIDTVRCCVEIGRNVRAACSNKVIHDQLIMSIVEE
jgi:hypothetical protein